MTKYKLNKGFIEQELEGKTVIFDPESSALFTLNETASFIHKLVTKQKPADQIITALCKTFIIDRPTALKDFRVILKDFNKKGIISSNDKP